MGIRDPHRPYDLGSGAQSGKVTGEVVVPPDLPDDPVTRNDILDYFVEVEQSGQVENTVVVMTTEHGMPFPRAKASLYDYGSRVPLAICWPPLPAAGSVEDFVSLIDLVPTFL